MVVRVRLFGPEAALVGADVVDVPVDAGATCAHVLDALQQLHPGIAGRLAVNHAFAQPETVVRDSDEVALIGLVSGG